MSTYQYWSPRSEGTGGVIEQGAIVSGVTPGAHFGAVEDQVVLFSGPTQQIGPTPVPDWLTVTNDPIVGTTLVPLVAGIYVVFFELPLAGGSTAIDGITKDATLAQRTGATVIESNQLEVYSSNFVFGSLLAGLPTGGVAIPITPDEAEDPTRGVIRVCYGNVAGGPLAAAALVNPTGVACRIVRTGAVL